MSIAAARQIVETLEFVDALPEPRPRGGSSEGAHLPWAAVLNACAEQPGKWAKLPFEIPANQHGATCSQIRQGKRGGAAPGEFDACIRDGQLWVSYVGPVS